MGVGGCLWNNYTSRDAGVGQPGVESCGWVWVSVCLHCTLRDAGVGQPGERERGGVILLHEAICPGMDM